MTTTTMTEKPVAVGTKIIEGAKYQVFFTDDPDCPVVLERITPQTELGHKGRGMAGR